MVRNRGGTAIDRWQARGDLDGEKLNAIQAYQSAWRLFLEPKRVTANWSGGTGGGAGGEEQNVVAKLQAKASVTIRLDSDIIDRFHARGPGWQTRINETLRKAM
jgi:hypothetical protein